VQYVTGLYNQKTVQIQQTCLPWISYFSSSVFEVSISCLLLRVWFWFSLYYPLTQKKISNKGKAYS
jgi:hypothetical protein